MGAWTFMNERPRRTTTGEYVDRKFQRLGKRPKGLVGDSRSHPRHVSRISDAEVGQSKRQREAPAISLALHDVVKPRGEGIVVQHTFPIFWQERIKKDDAAKPRSGLNRYASDDESGIAVSDQHNVAKVLEL